MLFLALSLCLLLQNYPFPAGQPKGIPYDGGGFSYALGESPLFPSDDGAVFLCFYLFV